jgi:Tfp pilus assembly pilus retraction ATPase PilT
VIAHLAEQPRGLVLVTGPTGSGKTITDVILVGEIRALYGDGVIELEDALGGASNPHDLQVALRNQGLVAWRTSACAMAGVLTPP